MIFPCTSYFYNVRFLEPWQIPLSTACWDPAWYHDFKGQSHKFFDKRNVLNGLRAEKLHPDNTCMHLCRGQESCSTKDPSACEFLKKYRIQLDRLDKDTFIDNLLDLEAQICAKFKIMSPVQFVLLVHEPPYKKCSERQALQESFGLSELQPKAPMKLNQLSVFRANRRTIKSIDKAAWSKFAYSSIEMSWWIVLDAEQHHLFTAHSWTEMVVKCAANGLEVPSTVERLSL